MGCESRPPFKIMLGSLAGWLSWNIVVQYSRRSWVRSPVGASMGGNRWRLLSHSSVFLSVSLSLPLSLKPVNMSSGED